VYKRTESYRTTILHIPASTEQNTQVFEARLFKLSADERVIMCRMNILVDNNVFIIGVFNGASSSSY
jgi:hypothetical protein